MQSSVFIHRFFLHFYGNWFLLARLNYQRGHSSDCAWAKSRGFRATNKVESNKKLRIRPVKWHSSKSQVS